MKVWFVSLIPKLNDFLLVFENIVHFLEFIDCFRLYVGLSD